MISINIEIDGKKIELTMEEAKKLHGELDSILGKKDQWMTPRRDDTISPFTAPLKTPIPSREWWNEWRHGPTLISIK